MGKLKFFSFLVGAFSIFSFFTSAFSTCAFKVEARHVQSKQANVAGEVIEREIITLRIGRPTGVTVNGATVELAKRLLCASTFKLIKKGTGVDLNKYLVRGSVASYRSGRLENKFELVFSFPKDYVKLFSTGGRVLTYISENLLNKDGSASDILEKEIENVTKLIYDDESFKKIAGKVLKIYKGVKKPNVVKEKVLEVVNAILINGIGRVEMRRVCFSH